MGRIRPRPGQPVRLYNSNRWQKLRARQLATFPLCWYCEQAGRVTPADTVDHYRPHKGDPVLFWDPDNLKSSCTACHNSIAAIKDLTGIAPGCDRNGDPLDPAHPWYTGQAANKRTL